jgi:farnesyl diphosphate synthase
MSLQILQNKSITEEMEVYSKMIYKALNNLLPQDGYRLTEAMRYSLLSGGKCLRSFYLIKVGLALGAKLEDLLLPAACIEMIHTYSLIHDDLPAMDDDDIRRGKLTCHKEYDEATAILAGDSLLTLAFELLSSSQLAIMESDKIKIISIIALAIGYKGMAGGQMLDMLYEDKEVNIQDILVMQGMKTAKLFEASGHIAAIISKTSDILMAKVIKASFALGLTFQIVDDILDEIGDEKLIGKKTKKDIARGKSSIIAKLGVDGARNRALEIICVAQKVIECEMISDFYQDISKFIIERQY